MRISSDKVFLGLLGLIVLALSGAWLLGYRVNLTPSVPCGLYRQLEENPVSGDLASYCLESSFFNQLARKRGYLAPGYCDSGLRPLLKQVAGQPGDLVELTADGLVAVNGRVLADSAPAAVDSQGRPMPAHVLRPGPIPAG